jgi:hypothetical protein
MPSRRRPKVIPPAPLSDIARFAQSVRESEEADRRAKKANLDRKAAAKQAIVDRKTEAERRKIEAVELAARIKRVKAAHQLAVEMVKEATRTGRGAAAADLAWRAAKADLLELETGHRPAWAARAAESSEATVADEPDASSSDE